MMYRVLCVIVAVLTGVVLISPLSAQQGDGIRQGEKLEGELTEKKDTPYKEAASTGTRTAYSTELPIKLKAGQAITFSATVVGKDRTVTLVLVDPTGIVIAKTPWDYLKLGTLKRVQLTFEEVNATGTYKIWVSSDRIGPFSLLASDSSNGEGGIKALETRIDQLEKELTAAKTKLNALKAKSGRFPPETAIEKK